MGYDTWEIFNDGTTYDYPCDCFAPDPSTCTPYPMPLPRTR